MNGTQQRIDLKQTDLDSLILALTVSDVVEYLVTVLRNGAEGYPPKDTEPEIFFDKQRDAAQAREMRDQARVGMLARAPREDNATASPADANLTEREHDILCLIAEAMTNKMIARELDISEGTVKVHVKNLLRKLHLHSRLEAGIWALEHGIKQ